MTLREFQHDIIWRDIPDCPNYQISNKGQIKSFHTNRLIEPIKRGSKINYNIRVNGETKCINAYNLMLKVFNDLKITDFILQKYMKNGKIRRVYFSPNHNEKKPWRVIIQKDKKQYFFGYHRTQRGAIEASIKGYLILNKG